MEDDILGRVVEVEREIQKRLEDEKNKAAARLEVVRRESEEAVSVEESRLKASLERARQEARLDAENRAKELRGRAQDEASRLERADADTLKGIIMHHIIKTLPGYGHDRQDIKG